MTLANDNRAYAQLAERFATAGKLAGARAILNWDAQTYMPKGGAWGRGEVQGALQAVTTDIIAAPDAAELLAAAEEADDALTAAEKANLAEMRRIWRHRAAAPKELLIAKARCCARLEIDWLEAKTNNDFPLFAKGFGELLPIIRETAQAKAAALGLSALDALIDAADPGLTVAAIEPIFADMEAALPALLAEAVERQKTWPAPIPLTGDFSIPRQRALSEKLAAAVGHSPEHLRIDPTAHPFAQAGTPGDNRITTRFDEDNIRFAVMATLHESGHALYESGLPRAMAFQPAGVARGASAHESQSLSIEMQAGRSREFLSWLAPRLGEAFGEGPCWGEANLINHWRRVGEGYIRVEADEISYPLHVILRFRLEQALLSGDLTVADLPGAWSDLSQKLFGRRPPDHARGCLQDIHWAAGLFGYFPNYALGAALAAQLFAAAVGEDGEVLRALALGDFGPWRAWIGPRFHGRASEVSFSQLVHDATGAPLSAAALKRHLRARYIDEPAPA